jgi:hypothetical protein
MNVIKFQEHDQQAKNHIVYCIIDKTSTYTHNREVIKNISDWTIQNITIQGYTVLVSTDEDSLLHTAADTIATHAIVLSTGTEFINSYDWFEYAEEYCKQDFFLAGHVLDRSSAYYELHDQCYIINLIKYKELNFPPVGQQELSSRHTTYMPTRSIDNWHDDYTPKTVAPGSRLCKYEHKCHGWNILNVAWNNNYPVLVFDSNLRDNKIHYYPEWNSYFDQINYAHTRDAFCSGLAIYLSNSEVNVDDNIVGPIEQLVVTASGLNWTAYLNKCGFTNNTVVKFYDYSYLTLEYMKHLVENWDGHNYAKFALSYFNNKFSFVGGNIPFCGSVDLPEIDHTVWNQIKSTVKFEYHLINILDSTKDINWITTDCNTVINLTNIFNYIGTATTRSVRERIYVENSFIEKLQAHVPNAYVIFTRRASDGFVNSVQNTATLAKDLKLTDITTLTKPTWHMNQDWS